MKKIEKLTPKQEVQLREFHAKMLAIGMSCEPADRPRAENAIKAMYAEIGEANPTFLWCQSPATCILAIAVLNKLGKHGLDSLGASLGDSLRDSLWDSLGDSLGASLRDSRFWGQHELYWIAFYEFCKSIGGKCDPIRAKHLHYWSEIGQSAGWWWPYKRLVIISDRPQEVHMEPIPGRVNQLRLHREDGPALLYRDGWPIYSIHGIRIANPDFIVDPSKLTVQRIQAETNAEVRRVMVSRYGAAKYLRDAGAQLLHEDAYGKLWRIEQQNDVPIVMVEVCNSTPEPLEYQPNDGESGEWKGKRWFKHYWMRVDPELRPLFKNKKSGEPQAITARNAVASTMGLRGEQYTPMVRS